MSKSKSNQSHKDRVNKFKEQIRKSKNMSEQKIPKQPFTQQYPVWNSQENMEMNGLEFEAIYNLINLFRNGVMAAESVLQKNVQNGKIKWVFKDENGKEVPENVIKDYQIEIQRFFEAQEAEKNKQKPITAEEQKDLPKLDGLVDSKGNELKAV